MNKAITRILSALLFAVLLMAGGSVYAQSARSSRSSVQRQARQFSAEKDKDVKISPELEEALEANTITVINTDEVRIVTNKKGIPGFQLKHLDILWATRAAMSGMVAVFLMLIIAFTKASTKQGITVLLFVAGSALVLSFYPFGISFMIMQWNKTYGLAAMGGGALLTIITLFLANRLRLKTIELEDKERSERPIPDVFPGGEGNQGKSEEPASNMFPGNNVERNDAPVPGVFSGGSSMERNEPPVPNVFPRGEIQIERNETPVPNVFPGGEIQIERNETPMLNVFPGGNNTEKNEPVFPSVFPAGNNTGQSENSAPEIFFGGNNGDDDMPEFFSGEINKGKIEMPAINNISLGGNNQGQKDSPAPNIYFGDNNDEMPDIFPGGNINQPPPSGK